MNIRAPGTVWFADPTRSWASAPNIGRLRADLNVGAGASEGPRRFRSSPHGRGDAIPAENLVARRLGETMPAPICGHLDQTAVVALPPHIAGCEECLKIGGRWLRRRMCMSCDAIGCCGSSPNRHASGHARDAGHPITRSAEPGEKWSWCYLDEVGFVVDAGGEVR